MISGRVSCASDPSTEEPYDSLPPRGRRALCSPSSPLSASFRLARRPPAAPARRTNGRGSAGPTGRACPRTPSITPLRKRTSRGRSPCQAKGHSSPVVWGDHVYITSGDPETAARIVLCLKPQGRQHHLRSGSSPPRDVPASCTSTTATTRPRQAVGRGRRVPVVVDARVRCR